TYGFQISPKLPVGFEKAQAIAFKDEILICGGSNTGQCYSYHTQKKKYRRMCSYPENVQLNGHCVLQWSDPRINLNTINLLSFGGQPEKKDKYAFKMKYQSVWGNFNAKSQWEQCHFQIGDFEDNLVGARGLIGGKDNNLLFITHFPKKIQVINLETGSILNKSTTNVLPVETYQFGINYHCFVPLTIKNDCVTNCFILFCYNTGLLINFNEHNRTFEYEKLPICPALKDSNFYSFVHHNDYIFLLGGKDSANNIHKKVWKYSMKYKTWSECEDTLPIENWDSFAVIDKDNTIHNFGGIDINGYVQKKPMHVSMQQLLNVGEKEKQSKLIEEQTQYITNLTHENQALNKKTNELLTETIKLKQQIETMKVERPYFIPEISEVPIKIEPYESIPKGWSDIENTMQNMENTLQGWESKTPIYWKT
ncbi:hypothetical protein RFI_34010, partial [Reticulomyxa filosa]